MLAGLACVVASAGSARADRPSAGSLTPERLKVPSGPSSIRGLADEPKVDPFNAQLNYQVPIELPSGLGGLGPALALTYSGGLGNGPLGIGWSLSHAKIQRSTRLGVPSYDDSVDEFEISGIVSGRLISIGSGEYRVEGLGQSVRVTRVDGGFQVDDGKGVRYRLGTSAGSRQESDATHTLAWLVERETNQMGEQIQYQYTHDRGQVYLASLAWGPGAVYGVTLDYATRGDPTTSYRGGFAVVTAQLLSKITVRAFGVERRAYQLSYAPPAGQPSFPVARLSGVNSTGKAGAGAWPALAFHYAAPVAAQITPIAGVGTWRLNDNGTTLVDLDGDGASDLLQAQSGSHSYRVNQNGTFGNPITLTGNTQPLSSLQLQDVDGDARPEMLQDGSDGWSVWKWSKTRWNLQPGTWPGSKGLALKDPAQTRFADVNGDGLIDAIKWNTDGLSISLATRTGFSAARSVGLIGGAVGVGVVPMIDGHFQDLNGDGVDDYVFIAPDHLDQYVGHGDGTFEPVVRVAYPFTGSLTQATDIELADLDRDGLLDLVKIEVGQVRWFQGRADGTFSPTPVTLANPETLSSAVVVTVADTNGNGSHDLVWSSTSGMWRMDLAGATTAGMLVEVTNGLGLDVTFGYQSSHALEVAAALAKNPWTSLVPIAMPVPVQKTTVLGPGETTRQISYAVRDGFWDATEQRFGGFLATTVTTWGATPAQTSTVITQYNKGTGVDRELRGTVTQEQVRDGSGKLLALTSNTWATMAIAGLPDTPLLRRAILQDTTVEYDEAVPVRNTEVAYSYDTLGRATHTVDSGRLDLTGDESVRDVTYADDATIWIRDQVCEEKVSDTAGHVVTDVQHLFGDDVTVQPLCVVGKGWPRETRTLLASESRFITQSQTSYSAAGNPINLIEAGVTRKLTYDSTGLFPIEEHMTAPGYDLAWLAGWDQVLGALTTVTDPAGHTLHTSYDSLGRNIGAALDGHLQHQIIEYDTTPPYPKTTIWDFDGALADVTARPAAWSATSKWRQTVEVHNGAGEVRYRAQRLADTSWIISDYRELDPASRVVFAGRPVLASQLELAARPAGIVGDALIYDPLGRLIEQDAPTGGVLTYSYAAFERTVQEADLAPVHSVLDGKRRPITTERTLANGTHEIVQASYDAAGRLTTMQLAGGAVMRSFAYDTLGRLTRSQDPDLGARTIAWDDGNRMTSETNAAGQTIQYTYDGLGRLATVDNGAVYRYHYDTARSGATGALTNLAGRLAWVEEPLGGIDVGYDDLGRTTFTRRRIDARASEATTTYSASGLVLRRAADDGFALDYHYDPAGRVTGAGDLWSVVAQDASGMPLQEATQNGVHTQYERDALSLPSRVTLRDVGNTAIYDVRATRNLATEITAITDLDGVGLDHTATFGYDGFARLTSASIGSGAQAFAFGYGYDVLHNMTSRTATGPHAIAAFTGSYRYGEAGRAPRQLTSIADAGGTVVHAFGYDAAGRQTTEDGKTMTYDAADRLLRVDGATGGTVSHAYGYDGMRVKTIEPDGTILYLFGDGVSERGGAREHDVTVGARVVARVAMPGGVAGGGALGSQGGSPIGMVGKAVLWGLGVMFAGLSLLSARPRVRRRARAAGMLGLLLATSCAPSATGSRVQAVAAPVATFLHVGFSAGPVVFTDAGGHLVEERRYEPFGVPIDAHIHTASQDTIGAPDLVARDLNPFNKRTEPTTGWSDHGARWLAPETGRWLTPDPLVDGPSVQLMNAPWALHPYQYVHQNPIAYWDPDGRQAAPNWAPVAPPVAAPVGPTLTSVPMPPELPPPVAPAVVEGTEGAVATGVGATFAAVAVGALILFWPTTLGDDDDACRRCPKTMVNLDTGAMVNATQLSDLGKSVLINNYLADKDLVATHTAVREFLNGKAIQKSGLTEKLLVALFLLRVTEIPEAPSARIMALDRSSNNKKEKLGEHDLQIFGTGDTHRIVTVTTDAKFVKEANRQFKETGQPGLIEQTFERAEYSGN